MGTGYRLVEERMLEGAGFDVCHRQDERQWYSLEVRTSQGWKVPVKVEDLRLMDERVRDGCQAGLATLVLLSLGHSTVDLYSGALGALQPVLLGHLGLSLADVGILGGVFVVASSLAQPAYGYLSDRIHTRLFAALGPAVAGICISFLGLAPTFGWLLALAALGASGVAAFHPQASSAVAFGTERNRGTWMAVFVTAGTLGYSLGRSEERRVGKECRSRWSPDH